MMDSQLISNAVRRFFLMFVLMALLTGSTVKGATYVTVHGTIVDPILDRLGTAHFHSGSNLEPYVNLFGAYLSHANLYGTYLSHADLSNADLSHANLHGADLSIANLYGANLTDVYRIENTRGSPYYYGNTRLPNGFDPVAKDWTLAPFCDFTLTLLVTWQTSTRCSRLAIW